MGGSDVAASPHDIENPLETLKMKLEGLSPLSPLRCIHRVPDRLRRGREKDYTPHVISIGPYHHGNLALKGMEDQKRWYLHSFMERSHPKLNDYIEKIREQEVKLRNCYTETIVLDSDQFVTMVLVDAIFLIEFLHRYGRILRDENDCIFGTPIMYPDVQTDLLMLENQLPLFILDDLLSVYNPESGEGAKQLSVKFLKIQARVIFGVNLDIDDYSSQVEGQHFVDLLRNLLVAPLSEEEKLKGTTKYATAPSIEKLHLAGGKIHGETSIPNMFAIRFYDNWILKSRILKNGIPKYGILKIPKLRIGLTTELILRNLIAFEQCSMSNHQIICHYVILMDKLVDSPKDVELLVKHKIVENLLADDHELSSMFNGLANGIISNSENFYYGALCGKMDKFCNSNWPKWKQNLRSRYFNTPWTTLSVVAAVVLLILTAIQTICSIYQTF
ncbi:hypothetical protein ACLB2K_010196 [Fragaria x ananassa]